MKKLLGLLLFSICSFSIASEKSMYDFSWLDKDKEVYVLQNRKYRKKSKLYLGTTFGKSLSGAFVDRYTGSFYGGYFFNENWGLEVSYNKASNTTNSTHDAVKTAGTVAFYRKIDSDITAHLVWSPFYSKINTFNKIVYYDWLFGLGVSSLTTQDNRNEFKNESDPDHDALVEESATAFSWFTGFRFFISESWSMRMDFKGTHSNADRAIEAGAGQFDVEKSWFHYYDFKLGLNYTF